VDRDVGGWDALAWAGRWVVALTGAGALGLR